MSEDECQTKEEKLVAQACTIAEHIEKTLPGMGFSLWLFELGDVPSPLAHLSNADRAALVKHLRISLQQQEALLKEERR